MDLEPSPEDWSKFGFSEDDKKTLVIDKKTVAGFMLQTAIQLWFRQQDVISQHLLAASAAEVLKGVGKTQGVTSHVFNEEMEEQLGKKLKLAMNFFKHAHSDPKQVLRFAPIVTEFFLIDATQMYAKLYSDDITPLMRTFRAWFMVVRGSAIVGSEVQIFLPDGVAVADVARLSREDFAKRVQPLFAAQNPLRDGPEGL